jgi:hypothetical protein
MVEISQYARHLKLIFFEDHLVKGTMEHYTQGTKQLLMAFASEPHVKRDLMRWDRREPSPSAGELQCLILKQLILHVMVPRQDGHKVFSWL